MVQPWRDDAGRFEVGPERTLAELSGGSGWTFGAPSTQPQTDGSWR
jgi:hypothetical protein